VAARILVVDDAPAVRSLVPRVREDGHDVVTIPKPFDVTAVKSAVRALLPETT
jgi:hypothetical protein